MQSRKHNPQTHFCDARDNKIYKFVEIGTYREMINSFIKMEMDEFKKYFYLAAWNIHKQQERGVK